MYINLVCVNNPTRGRAAPMPSETLQIEIHVLDHHRIVNGIVRYDRRDVGVVLYFGQ